MEEVETKSLGVRGFKARKTRIKKRRTTSEGPIGKRLGNSGGNSGKVGCTFCHPTLVFTQFRTNLVCIKRPQKVSEGLFMTLFMNSP